MTVPANTAELKPTADDFRKAHTSDEEDWPIVIVQGRHVHIDNVLLYAADRIKAADKALADCRAEIETLKAAALARGPNGCDAGVTHRPVIQGRYTFCADCGETVSSIARKQALGVAS